MHTQAEVVVRVRDPGPEIMSDFRLQLRKKQILQLET